MLFTQEQIEEIRERLSISGSKDTKLPLVLLPLSGEETIALVQQGENKRVPIENFYEEFARYIDHSERVDLFNVSRYVSQQSDNPSSGILTLDEAIAACPNDVRRPGQLITFETPNHEWALWQFQGDDAANWSNTALWHCYEGTDGKFWIVDITSSGVATDRLGRKWQFAPYVENYVTRTANWTYDGQTHPLATTNTAFTIYWAATEEGLADSESTSIPTARNAGSYTWYWKAVSNGSQVATGVITVNVGKRTVTLTSASATAEYNPEETLTDNTPIIIDNALEAEPFEAEATGSQHDAGSSKNTINITTYPPDYGTNYTINKVEGTLQVTQASNNIEWVTAPPSSITAGGTINVSAEATFNSESIFIKYHFGSVINTTGIFTPGAVDSIEVWATVEDANGNYADATTSRTTVNITSIAIPMYWGKMSVYPLDSTTINASSLESAISGGTMHSITSEASDLRINAAEESIVVLVPSGYRSKINDGITTNYVPYDSTFGENGSKKVTIDGIVYYIYGQYIVQEIEAEYKVKIEKIV